MELTDVRYEIEDGLAWITIDRQDRMNAFRARTVDELIFCLKRAWASPDVGVVCLTGAGERAFCAGGDIGGFQQAAEDQDVESAPAAIARLLDAVWWHPKPTLARVNGKALGGGFGLMLACDLAVATDDAEVGTPEIDIGLWPHVITAVIQRRLPRGVALELMLTGRRMPVDEATRWGLVNRVIPRPELDSTVTALVDQIASKSPHVVRLGKRSFAGAEDKPWGVAIDHLKERLAENLEAEDLVEGVSAFLQKRKPDWKGR